MCKPDTSKCTMYCEWPEGVTFPVAISMTTHPTLQKSSGLPISCLRTTSGESRLVEGGGGGGGGGSVGG